MTLDEPNVVPKSGRGCIPWGSRHEILSHSGHQSGPLNCNPRTLLGAGDSGDAKYIGFKPSER